MPGRLSADQRQSCQSANQSTPPPPHHHYPTTPQPLGPSIESTTSRVRSVIECRPQWTRSVDSHRALPLTARPLSACSSPLVKHCTRIDDRAHSLRHSAAALVAGPGPKQIAPSFWRGGGGGGGGGVAGVSAAPPGSDWNPSRRKGKRGNERVRIRSHSIHFCFLICLFKAE